MLSPDSFAARLARYTPTLESQLAFGLTPTEAEAESDTYRCGRIKPESQAVFDDPLLRLVDEFDTSTLEIGLVRFSREVEHRGGDYCIGVVEADPILVDRKTGRVRTEDLACPGHEMWPCGASGEQFLEALLLVAEFYGPDLVDYHDPAYQPRAHQMAAKCAEVAGGDEYHDLYLMLLGCEDME